MLDQSFSAKNFRRIFELENRNGTFIQEVLTPEILKITDKIKASKAKIRQKSSELQNLKKLHEKSPTQKIQNKIEHLSTSIKELREVHKTLRNEKEDKLKNYFENLSKEVTSGTLDTTLDQVSIKNGDTAYKVSSNATTYFPIKQIQRNLSKTFNTKASDRDIVLKQLSQTLQDKYPKIVIRTDVEKFYESIDRDILIKKVMGNRLLSVISKKAIRSILNNYEKASGNTKGLPRGIGISAFLSEIYMQDFDKELRGLNGLIFYARYVDDIVMVFDQNEEEPKDEIHYLNIIKESLRRLGLKINTSKTIHKIFPAPGGVFEYLGYSISSAQGKVKIGLSNNRTQRYRTKIDRSISDYVKQEKFREKEARKLLFHRLKFLTSNSHLVHNKRKAMIGIYFSNRHLTNMAPLNSLDLYMQHKISNLSNTRLRKRVSKLSFKDGFLNKQYAKFSTKRLGEIVKVWKNEV